MVKPILPVASASNVRRHVRMLLNKHRKTFFMLIGLQVVAAAAALVGPQVLANFVSDLSNGSATTAFLFWASGLFLAAVVVQTVFTGLARLRGAVLGESVLADLREDFVETSVYLPPGLVERAGTGDLVTRATTDIDRLNWAVRHAVPELVIAIVTATLVAIALIVTAPILALAWLCAVPPILIGTRWYMRRAPQAYAAEMASYTAVNTMVAESVDAGRTIETYRLGRRRVRDTDSAIKTWTIWERRTLFLRCVWFPTIEAGYVIPLVLVTAVGGLLHINGALTLEQFAASVIYTQMLIEPVDLILMWYDELQIGQASLARLIGVHDVPRDDVETETPPQGRDLRTTNLRFGYRDNHDVLHGLNLYFPPGQRIAIVGPSGAGKSTLGRLLAGVHPPRTGEVTVGGTSLAHLSTESVRSRIALVTQEHHVFTGTLRDNLAIASAAATDDEYFAALDAVDADWARSMPLGLDEPVGSGGTKLSPAQAQQVALARIVLADPHTLVLDEATSLLDPRSARHLERSLAAVLTGRTVIAIAHRLHTAHDAERIIVMEDGAVSEDGSHDELIAAGGAYASLWSSWRQS
jgi:ABC-type multidrug transport system fused ATPase/permease subunit